MKHFFKYFAANGRAKTTAKGWMLPAKNEVPLGGRSDPALLVRRNTGGRGFTVLGSEETEVDGTVAGEKEGVEMRRIV